MALRWSHVLRPDFIRKSIKRQGVIRSLENGLRLLSLRLQQGFFRTRLGRALGILLNFKVSQEAGLYAFYDLEKAANGFDVVQFLVMAELERLKAGFRYLHIVVVPPNPAKFDRNHSRFDFRGVNDFYARLHNILIPACWLVPTVRGVTVCSSRDEAQRLYDLTVGNVFPQGYSVRAPIPYVKTRYIREAVERGEDIPSIRAPRAVRQAAASWLTSVVPQKKAVTITLRESYIPERNSNLAAWAEFGRVLQQSGKYEPIFIRDTEKIFQDVPPLLENFIICREASLDVLFRSALYEESYLNLFINNGPVILCMLNKATRYMMFKIVTEANTKTTVEFLRDSQGMVLGESFPGATPYQKLVWEDDTLEVIEREFAAMCDMMERSYAR